MSVKNKSVSLFFLVWKKLDDNNLTIVKQIPLIFSSDHSVCQKLLCFLNYQLPSDMQFDINPGEMIGLGTLNSTVNNPLFYFTETESHVQVYSTNGLEYNVISNSDLILDYIATPQLQIEYAKAEEERQCFDQFVPSIPDIFNKTSPFQLFSRSQIIYPSAQFNCNGIITQLKGWYQVINDPGIVEAPVLFQVWHSINQSHYGLVSEVGIPPAADMTAITVNNLSLPFYNGSVVGIHIEFPGTGAQFVSIKRDVNQFSAPRAYYLIGTRHCVADVNEGAFQSFYLPEVVISYDIIEDANVTLTINDCNFISNIENRRSRNHPRTIIIIASTTSVIVLLAVVASIAGCHFWKKRKLTKPNRRVVLESCAYDSNPGSVFSSMFYYRLESVLNDSMVFEDTNSYVSIDDSSNLNEVPYKHPATDLEQICLQLSHVEIPNESIELGNEIGSGQFGTVLHGMWDHSGYIKQVAIKTLHGEATSEEDKVKLLKEAAIIEQFGHKNIVKLYGVLTDGNPMMILEYLSNGDLLNYLVAIKPKKGEIVDQRIAQTLLGFARDVGHGMNYLSNKCFIHRDLAARNILLTEDNVCKIADFGMSRDLEDENYYVTQGGYVPLKWTAPEALLYRTYTTASDVWSYGILLYEMWSLGHKPYADFDNTEVVDLLDTGYRLPPPPGCPRFIYSLMMQCWNSQHKFRPGFDAIMRAISQPSYVLFHWFEEDKQAAGPECDVIGAHIEAGHNLYQDLQNMYR
ncbi:uncharacterized protein [Dysidea avara]|uniref:uncharacterized protein isoform X2 n=1 Tax=Dysidea avara TaxID=196820 RepID=UPI003318831A